MNPLSTAYEGINDHDLGGATSGTAFFITIAAYALCWWLAMGPLKGKLNRLQELLLVIFAPAIVGMALVQLWRHI